MTHDSRSLRWKSPTMVGSAVETIVWSSAARNMPSISAGHDHDDLPVAEGGLGGDRLGRCCWGGACRAHALFSIWAGGAVWGMVLSGGRCCLGGRGCLDGCCRLCGLGRLQRQREQIALQLPEQSVQVAAIGGRPGREHRVEQCAAGGPHRGQSGPPAVGDADAARAAIARVGLALDQAELLEVADVAAHGREVQVDDGGELGQPQPAPLVQGGEDDDAALVQVVELVGPVGAVRRRSTSRSWPASIGRRPACSGCAGCARAGRSVRHR